MHTMQTVEGERDRRLSNGEAAAILDRIAAERFRTVEEVEALAMGARRMLGRSFQRHRKWARRRAAAAAELAATVARQRELDTEGGADEQG